MGASLIEPHFEIQSYNMRKIRFSVYFLLTAFFILAIPQTPTAKAVSLSPLTFELSANPGDTVSNILKVTNTDPNPVNIVVDVEDFAAVGEEGQVTLLPGEDNSTYSLASWVTVSPSLLSIPAHDSATVEFTVNVPFGAEPGGHYGSVLATVSTAPTPGAVTVAQKIGSLLLMNVAGDVEERLHIAEFSVEPFSEYGPVTILSRFENTGTVHLKPRGFILIKNMFGREVEKLDLPQKNVLPKSIRRIEVPWGSKLMFGRYEAILTAIYGSTNQPLSSVTTFWVIPWKIAGAILIGLVALLSLLIKGRKRIRLALAVLFKGTHKYQV